MYRTAPEPTPAEGEIPTGGPRSALWRECGAEFLGTFLLVVLGPSSVIVASALSLPPGAALVFIAFSFSATVGAAILVLRRYSRVYINPGVALAAAVAGRLPPRSLIPYVGSQLLGGLAAGLCLWIAFGSLDASTHLGSTRLSAGTEAMAGFAMETAGTLALACGALLASSRMRKAGRQALVMGGILFVLILAIGPWTGAGLNPARSVGPAVASGWLDGLALYIIGPLAGGLMAGIAFRLAGSMRETKQRLLFVCVENAGRSQMARAFAERLGLEAESAGTMPAPRVNPAVVAVMKERGIDLSEGMPRLLTPEMIDRASLVVTMGCSAEAVCPRPMLARMQKKLVDWDLDDPKGRPVEEVRRIRDEIERRVADLAKPGRDATTLETPGDR